MDEQVTPALAQSNAVRAFEDLRGEVSLLRRAIEGLAAERRDQPDYGPTLEALAASNDEIRNWARKVNERPALRLTPEAICEQIEAATARFRDLDRQELAATHVRFESAIKSVTAIATTARTAAEQARRVKLVSGMSVLAGIFLTLIAEIT
jgi:hypothetical protein